MLSQKEISLITGLSPIIGLPLVASTDNKPANRVDTPNVILILADDMGFGDLGCYGARNVGTPHVDSLARRGVRFTNCHAVASISTPSRYSLLTGEYSWRKKNTDVANGDAAMIIQPSQYTLADLFRDKGYATAVVGKWHLGLGDESGQQDWNGRLNGTPADLGFDYHYIMAATADRVPCVFIENGEIAHYDPASPVYVSYKKNFSGEPTGRDNPRLLYNLKPSHGHDMSIVNGISRIGYMKGGGKALWKDENIADSITSHAVDFIRRQGKKPFFMYFATNDVHVPRFPHERFRGKSGMGLRGDAIAQFDWSVGEIVKQLRIQGILDNTLIILTSDNGAVTDDGYDDKAEELLNGHRPSGPFRGYKYSAFEGGTMVPFIVCWNNHIKGGKVSDALLSQIDLFKSLSSLICAPIPQGVAQDSRDYISAFRGKDRIGRAYVVEQNYKHVLSVRNKKWKYIEPGNGSGMIPWGPKIETGNSRQPQLYDMSKNLYEQENVADKYPKVLLEMQRILKKERTKSQ